jgi:hypothetical protein
MKHRTLIAILALTCNLIAACGQNPLEQYEQDAAFQTLFSETQWNSIIELQVWYPLTSVFEPLQKPDNLSEDDVTFAFTVSTKDAMVTTLSGGLIPRVFVHSGNEWLELPIKLAYQDKPAVDIDLSSQTVSPLPRIAAANLSDIEISEGVTLRVVIIGKQGDEQVGAYFDLVVLR